MVRHRRYIFHEDIRSADLVAMAHGLSIQVLLMEEAREDSPAMDIECLLYEGYNKVALAFRLYRYPRVNPWYLRTLMAARPQPSNFSC